MALQVWLPLNGNVNNQGLSDLTFSVSSTTTINDNGKIGKCYENNSFTTGGLSSDKTIDLGQNQSMFCWFKINSLIASSLLGGGLVTQHNHTLNQGMGITIRYVSATTGYLSVSTGNGTSRTYNTYYGETLLQAGTWYHGGYTYDGATIRLYVNGSLDGEFERSDMKIVPDNIQIYRWSLPTTSYSFNGCLNDVRIYDNVLSPREIKEISKGKILHYTLSDSYNLSNIIYNGFGEYGTTGWSSGTTASTSDLPSDTAVKAAFTGGQTAERIPINTNNTYALSCYIKSAGATSGTTYPSILPYDIDGNFISNIQCRDGFSTVWQATLTQPLNKGDTVVYCSDLSNWSTATDNYYFIAVFGYKDSYGNVYPDFEYTRDSLSFGSRSDKSKLNKTNNTITLNSAYTGEPRPVGTKVCQASAGSTYYYPFGALALASLQDWTHKTATLNIKNINRLKYAKSIILYNYPGGMYAGIKMTDTTWGTTTVYDVSGFCNNGEAYTTDGTGQFLTEPNSPRYYMACNIHSLNSTTSAKAGTAYIRGDCELTTPQQLTIAFWCYARAEGYTSTTNQGVFCTTNLDGDNIGTDYQASAMNHRDGNINVNPSSGSQILLPITFIANQWHHYAFTYDGQYARAYKDGVLFSTKNFSSAITLGTFKHVIIGFSRADNVWRRNNNSYSDFRVYATALNDQSIEELYNTPITLSNSGSLLTQGEYAEV